MKVYLPNDIWYYIGDYLQPPEVWNIVWAGHIILKEYAISSGKYNGWYGFMQMLYYLPQTLLNFMGEDFRKEMDFTILYSNNFYKTLATDSMSKEIPLKEIYFTINVVNFDNDGNRSNVIKYTIKLNVAENLFSSNLLIPKII